MILNFKTRNFLSFKEENSLSTFYSSTPKLGSTQYSQNEVPIGNLKISNVLTLLGDNFSGKTNFLKAIRYMVSFINSNVSLNYPFTYLNKKENPTLFEMVFFSNKTIYYYGFEILNGNIKEEWLGTYVETENKSFKTLNIIEREGNNLIFSPKFKKLIPKDYINSTLIYDREQELFGLKDVNLPESQLFLNCFFEKLNSNKILKEVKDYFQNNFIFDLEDNLDFSFKEKDLNPKLLKELECWTLTRLLPFRKLMEENNLFDLSKFPSLYFSTGKFQEMKKSESLAFLKELVLCLNTLKSGSENFVNTNFKIKNYLSPGSPEEKQYSKEDGIWPNEDLEKFFKLNFLIFYAALTGKVLILDSLLKGVGFHPMFHILRVFQLNFYCLKNNSQLILATSGVEVLDKRFNLTEYQIYFTEKFQNVSSLSCLAEFKGLEKNKEVRKDYILGRYCKVDSSD